MVVTLETNQDFLPRDAL